MRTIKGRLLSAESFESKKGTKLVSGVIFGDDKQVYEVMGMEETFDNVSEGMEVTATIAPDRQKVTHFINGIE